MTPLPGIGTRQDFLTREGRRVGVIAHRDGHFELIASKVDDPDTCTSSVPLTAEEAGALAGLMGAPTLVAQLAEQQSDIQGVTTKQFPLAPGSPYDGRTLGDTAMRTRTAASLVAVVRSGTVHASPRPDFTFEGNDLLVIVGTSKGLAAAADILETG